jgi:hypothetical protein
MEVAVELDDGDVITIYRVVSVTDDTDVNAIEVAIHEDTDLPDELDLCIHEDIDLYTLNSARIEEPGTIWFEGAKIVHASE